MRTWVLFFLLPTVWGCSQDNASPTSRYIQQNPRPKIDENLKQAKLDCESSSACPENVGYILSNVGEDKLAQCTGWLIASDVIATNSHCIPDEVKKEPSRCMNDIGIKMPQTNTHEEEIHVCSELLHHSELAAEGTPDFIRKADYAFFRIDRPSKRMPFKFSRAGIADEQAITIFSVDPMSRYSPQGRIVRRECKAYKHSLVMPKDTHAYSEVSVVFGPECTGRHGNSGSPAVDSEGRAVGWLHGGITADKNPEDSVDRSVIESRLLRPVMLTNGACIAAHGSLPIIGAPGSECASGAIEVLSEQRKRQWSALQRTQLAERVRKAYAAWYLQASNVLVFSAAIPAFKENEEKYTLPVELKPVCLKPMESWRKSNGDGYYTFKDRLKETDPASLALRLNAPEVRVSKKLDPYWRMVEAATIGADVLSLSIQIDPFTYATTGYENQTGPAPFAPRTCKPAEITVAGELQIPED